MEEKQIPMQISINPSLVYVDGVQVLFNEEEFIVAITSGNQINRYVFSPKHVKRLMLLLEKQVSGYEKKFSEIETSLPEASGKTASKSEFGFREKK